MRPRWLAACVFVFTWTLTTHGKYSASGDEPHYLMIAHSIASDGDLDLANDYAEDAGRSFGHAGLQRELHARPDRTGRMLSIHDIGVGGVLAPVFIVARQIAGRTSESLLRRFRMDRGLFAYSIISVSLIALSTFGIALIAGALAAVADRRASAMLVLAAAVSPPIVSHAFLVFPEVFALFATSVVVWFALKRPAANDTRSLLATMLLLGALPWTHHKYVIYVPGLLFVVVWMRWRFVKSLAPPIAMVAILLFIAPQVALHAWTWRAWGTFGGALTTEGIPFSFTAFKAGLTGLWLDRQSGLLTYAPLYWVLPACCLLTWKRTWPFLIPVALLYVPSAAFVIGWWAGFAPAARYLVPAIPLLLVPVVGALRYRPMRVALVVLCVPQLLIDAVVWQHPRALWPAGEGNAALARLGAPGRLYESILPPIKSNGLTDATLWIAVAVTAGTGVLVWACWREATRARPVATPL